MDASRERMDLSVATQVRKSDTLYTTEWGGYKDTPTRHERTWGLPKVYFVHPAYSSFMGSMFQICEGNQSLGEVIPPRTKSAYLLGILHNSTVAAKFAHVCNWDKMYS